MPLAVVAFAVWLGSFAGGAKASSVALGALIVGSTAMLGAWRVGVMDPLALMAGWRSGKTRIGVGRWLSLGAYVFVGLVALSRWMSPVPRVGLLWPSMILLGVFAISAVAWSLGRPARRVAGRWVLACGVLFVSTWALVDWLGGSPRPAAPLGHHNLLAIWLVVLWPLALLPGRVADVAGLSSAAPARSGAPPSTGRQVVDGAVLATAAMALLASRSLAGAIAFGVQLLWIARASSLPGQKRRVAHFGLLGVAMVAAVGWRRIAAWLGGGVDHSLSARWEYAQAAWAGWVERPVWGWGPGSSAWTLHLHLDGTRLAPGQVVTDAHALTLDLLYELGLVVVFAALLIVAWLRRTRAEALPEGHRGKRGGWSAATATSMVGMGVLSLGAGWFDVAALWVLLPFVLGCRLAVVPAGVSSRVPATWQRWSAVGLVLVAIWPLLGPIRAQRLQEQARQTASSAPEQANEMLARASALDAPHPLIRMDLARSQWAMRGIRSELAEAAVENALLAAEAAPGLAPLHLEAGGRWADWALTDPEGAARSGLEERALAALNAACDLAPQDGLAPFLGAIVGEPLRKSPLIDRLARALLAEPRLLVTPELLARPDLRRVAVDRITGLDVVPLGWRAALVEAEAGLPSEAVGVLEARPLELVTDDLGEISLSLFAFRRTAPPSVVARVLVDGSRLDFEIPPVYVLPEIARKGGLPLAPGCRLEATVADVRPIATAAFRLR